jgi:hypothetical protein
MDKQTDVNNPPGSTLLFVKNNCLVEPEAFLSLHTFGVYSQTDSSDFFTLPPDRHKQPSAI